jgi:hypothetical protein
MSTIKISQSDFEAIDTFIYTVSETNRDFVQHEYVRVDDNSDEVDCSCFDSYIAGEATATHGAIKIKFYWIAKGGEKTYSDAFNFNIEISNQPFDANIVMVDDDGDEVDCNCFDEVLSEKLNDAKWHQLVQSLLPTADIENIDIDEDTDMETFTIEIDNAPDIRFTGELLASTYSSCNQAMGSSYSGQPGRWTELDLYKTKGGKYICHQVGRTQWQGERDRFSGKVCETSEEVKEFFGHRWLAKELYAKAGIDTAVEIE